VSIRTASVNSDATAVFSDTFAYYEQDSYSVVAGFENLQD